MGSSRRFDVNAVLRINSIPALVRDKNKRIDQGPFFFFFCFGESWQIAKFAAGTERVDGVPVPGTGVSKRYTGVYKRCRGLQKGTTGVCQRDAGVCKSYMLP